MRFNDVEGAAKFLDDVHPDWYNKVDTKIINMASFTSCVLGQLYDGYSNGCKVLAIISYDEMKPFCGEYSQWVKEIENRRNKVKEYDMKTNPWFIRINDKEEHAAVVEFLKEKGYDTIDIPSYNTDINALTNAYCNGSGIDGEVMWSSTAGNYLGDVRKEIVVKFKSTLSIDNVTYPDVESPTQQKMRELEEQQRKIADEIAELRKEKEMFDMKKNPWYIKVTEETFPVVQEWLLENYGTNLQCDWFENITALTNTADTGEVCSDHCMWASGNVYRSAQEIKLSFKTIIDKVEWPVVESETQKQLRELEEQQRELADKIAKLRESV